MSPGPSDDATWSNHPGRAGLVGLVICIGLFVGTVVLVVVPLAAGSLDTGTARGAWLIATTFTAASVFAVVKLVAVARRGLHRLQNIALDASGLWWRCGGNDTLIPWAYIAGVGVEWVGSYGDGRVYTSLEVFLRDAELPADLRCYLTTGTARAGLPAERLSYPFARNSREYIDMHHAVERHAPGTWVGIRREKWTPSAFLHR